MSSLNPRPACRVWPILSAGKIELILRRTLITRVFFASAVQKPVVHEVVPEGEIEAEPDANADGISYACPKARIIAIKKVPGHVIRRYQNKMRLGR